MNNLRDKIKNLSDEKIQSVIDSLNINDLKFIDSKLSELNSNGDNFVVSDIKSNKEKIDVNFTHSVSYFRRD